MQKSIPLLVALSVAAGVNAQTLSPEAPSLLTAPLAEATNTMAIKIGAEKQEAPAEFIPAEFGSNNAPVKAEAPAAAAPTNTVDSAKVSFLVDTGLKYADEGEYAEAEQAYLRALQADVGNADILFRLATLYIQMQRYKDAVFILTALAEKFPDNPLVNNNLAWVYASGGEMKNGALAVRYAREAILSAPLGPSLWNTLAEAYYVTGQYEKALRSSERALELLNAQGGAKEEDVRGFQAQYRKIQRADEANKRLMGLDQDSK
jgi:tetratricopeptide (TPR) repeat protein